MDENPNEELHTENIIPINIEEEMKSAYIDYSMSVIVSRALPDVRDGLKPVHRRVLYGMTDLGLSPSRPHKKSARIVGEVLGKYHPHGDSSVYDTMVRMAQSWSLRVPMVDGQGNYGSIDGDPPAAMRYTEARLQKIAEEMLGDIEKDTVDFRPNFDDSLTEPTVLPSKIPNLLVNGASGIAVGMATNMAPHNLGESIDAVVAYIADNDITTEGLMEYIKGPDFPTGGIIHGYEGIKSAFETGRGRIVMRGRVEFETTKTGKEMITVHEVPFQVNPTNIIVKAAQLVNEKIIDGISAVRDESGRQGMRLVFEIKRDAIPLIVLNKLYKYTQLQSSFSVNNIALVKGRPEMLVLKDMIMHYVDHRHEIVVRRTEYDLKEARKRIHILEGLIIALDNLDAVIKLIRSSKTPEVARTGLVSNFGLTEIQARAILDLRLQKLTGLEIDKIRAEHQKILDYILDLEDILANKDRRMSIITEELLQMKEKYADERRTSIEPSADEIGIEDMIPNDPMVITISHMGYIKRTPLAEYREQRRGGRGNKGVSHRDEDFVENLLSATAHEYMLFFTKLGRCFWMRVYEIPGGAKTSKGRAIQNLINIPKNDKILAYVNVKNLSDEDYLNNNYIVMCTKNGILKKTTLEKYSRPRVNGINAINIREGDELLEAKLTNGKSHIILGKKSGKAIRFMETQVRPMGRTASGVKGVTLQDKKDQVVGMICIDMDEYPHATMLVVSEKGYGKRSYLDNPENAEDHYYRLTSRGGKGVKTLNITEKTGALIGLKIMTDDDGLMIINKSGITIRMSMKHLRIMGRATQGVRLIKIDEKDNIASIAKISGDNEDEDEILLDEDGNPIENSTEIGEEVNIENNGDDESTIENTTDDTPIDEKTNDDGNNGTDLDKD